MPTPQIQDDRDNVKFSFDEIKQRDRSTGKTRFVDSDEDRFAALERTFKKLYPSMEASLNYLKDR